MIPSIDLIDKVSLAEKIDVVLIVLNRDVLEGTVKKLNFDNVNLVNIVMDRDPEEPVPLFPKPTFYELDDEQVPVTTFATIHATMRNCKNLIWLIGGGVHGTDDALQMKNLLMVGGVSEDNILNLDVAPKISGTWAANLRHIEEYGADFFITGNESVQVGVNMNLIPTGANGGVNLADTNQTLRQGYLTAKHVFEHVAPGTIKFVLIGIEPHSFCCDKAEDFLNCTQNLQYTALFNEPTASDELLMSLLNDDFKKIFTTVHAGRVDVNFDSLKSKFNRPFSIAAIDAWDDTPQNFPDAAFDDNVQILNDYVELKDYIELCLANGAKPVGVILPFAPAVRKNYDPKFLDAFRNMIRRLEENYDFVCVDMFTLKFDYDCFCDTMHLNAHGQAIANALIALKLYAKNLLPAENFCAMSYEYFGNMSDVAPTDEYNALMERVFNVTVEKIRRKDKIKLAFVLHESTQWFGGELYNLFARDKRFETTFFLCTRITGATDNELFEEDFWRSVEQFSSRVSSIVVPEGKNVPVVPQDVIIFFTPFPSTLPYALRSENLTAKILVAHIPYAFDMSVRTKAYYNRRMFRVAWKIFFSSVNALEVHSKKNSVGIPRGIFSGYPRMDLFFKHDAPFKFDWKMARPDAKKIIWAPHWSITRDAKFATFQWNYQFMYEFAKTHPETSWIVKPHPGLFDSAVKEKIFPSVADFDEYLRAWNALPNAKVVIGAYYQNIFATSDGMIHDSDTFIAEYQYVDKPMIFLMRDTQKFNALANVILNVSYCADGQDFDAIAATLKRVIIDGDDYKAVSRKELFKKHLNYPKINGMSASEFIYRNIADELKGVSE